MSPIQIAMAAVTVTLWGINYRLTKFVVPELPPFAFLTLRMVLFLPLLLVVGLPPRPYRGRLLLLSSTQYVLPTGAVVHALEKINSGLVGILTQLETPLAALLGVVLLVKHAPLSKPKPARAWRRSRACGNARRYVEFVNAEYEKVPSVFPLPVRAFKIPSVSSLP